MNIKGKNNTLKAVLDVILYENPSTQDEIAEKLGLTRRYVTKLLQPLVKRGVVKRAYILDLKIVEQTPSLADQFNERPLCTKILLVLFQMISQVSDPVGEKGNLTFSTSSVHL